MVNVSAIDFKSRREADRGNMKVYTLKLTNEFTHTYTSRDTEVDYQDHGVKFERKDRSVFYPYSSIVYMVIEEEGEDNERDKS